MQFAVLLPIVLMPATAFAQSLPVEVWAVPGIYKVRPSEPAQKTNSVWDGSTRTISIAGARNEHIPFQVVLSTPPPPDRYHEAAAGFFVEASDLVSPKARLSSNHIRLYFEHAILCYGKSSPVGETGFWPDALAPLTDRFSMAAEFREAVKNRAVWIDVVTPTDIAAGDYTGTIRVTRNGSRIEELNLKLHVYDFALPPETHLITYTGVSSAQLAAFHHVKPSSPEARALLRAYHEFLYANRMEPWFNEPLQPRIEEAGDGVVARFEEQAYDLYMNQWKTKRVILESAPAEIGGDGRFPAFSAAYDRRLESYLKQVFDFYKSHG